MKTKKFDCVEMKRRGAENVRAQIAGMTLEQELEFWRGQTEELRRRQTDQRGARKTPTK